MFFGKKKVNNEILHQIGNKVIFRECMCSLFSSRLLDFIILVIGKQINVICKHKSQMVKNIIKNILYQPKNRKVFGHAMRLVK